MFADLFYLFRKRGLNVSLSEWMTLIEAMDSGLAKGSLTEFYYLSRAILVNTEADFDKFDLVFAEYFKGIEPFEELPQDLVDWLNEPIVQRPFDKNEVDARTDFDLDELKRLLEERLKEQKERHDGGNYWIGTGGTFTMGHSGYSKTGIRVGGESKNRSALQVAGERNYKDFREDDTLDLRQFQLAFRRLRQFTTKQDGAKSELDLDKTIEKTCDNAGRLKLVFDRPRINSVKLMILFDSGGSMWQYSRLCNLLFQAVSKSNHFKDLKVYYFHNCFYDRIYTTPSCYHRESIDTNWILKNLNSEYKVIVVGDGAMAPSELLYPGGNLYYGDYNDEAGIEWISRFMKKYDKMIWLNPLDEYNWEHGYGNFTIKKIKEVVPMHHLSVKGLENGLRALISG